jgi:hypothetical protein
VPLPFELATARGAAGGALRAVADAARTLAASAA